MNDKDTQVFFDSVYYRLLLEHDQKARMNPRNRKDYTVMYELLAELVGMGYCIQYVFELDHYAFTQEDAQVVPVIAGYFGKLENPGMEAVLCSALGKKGLYAAAEPLIKHYYDYRPPCYNSLIVDTILRSLIKIKNPDCIPKYIEMLGDETFRPEHLIWIIDLLGKFKAHEAVPQMLKLLDIEPFGRSGIQERQYLISLECIKTLAKFNDRTIIPKIEKFLEPERLPQFSRDRAWPDPAYPSFDLLKNVRKTTEQAIARISRPGK